MRDCFIISKILVFQGTDTQWSENWKCQLGEGRKHMTWQMPSKFQNFILVGIRDRTAGRYCDTWLWRMLDTIDRDISENLQRENQENHLRLLIIFICIIFVSCFRKWWKWWTGKKARPGQAEITGIQDWQEPHDWKTALSWINFCSDKDQLKC